MYTIAITFTLYLSFYKRAHTHTNESDCLMCVLAVLVICGQTDTDSGDPIRWFVYNGVTTIAAHLSKRVLSLAHYLSYYVKTQSS